MAPSKSPSQAVRQLTVRAVLTGMIIGGGLSLCNVYAGLKIGWSFNMSVTAAILAYGFWQAKRAALGGPYWGKLENNINQTAASAAASISSAGLVAPIPALTMITGHQWTWPELAAWTFSVALVGVVVAVALRRQMLEVDKLPFPMGVATAETLEEMYAHGAEAMARVKALVVGALIAGGLKVAISVAKIKHLMLPVSLSASGSTAAAGHTSISLRNLTFSLDPGLLMVGLGVIAGFRAGASMLFGAVVAWGVLGPLVLDYGWADPGKAAEGASWFGPMVKWMLWPGVVLMVTASLTSFAFSSRSVWAAIRGARGASSGAGGFKWALLGVLAFSVLLQIAFFGIGWHLAIFGVFLTFGLALVAARVSGETGLTPVGAMGKVTQLTFGVMSPGNVSANLMAANVTGGAASQAGDLLHDMKCGLLVGANPAHQAIAQAFGVLAGAVCGSAAYLLLVPDPNGMLITDEWAAPAVAQWKAVAELFSQGIDQLPPGTLDAMTWAAIIGVGLAIAEKKAPTRARAWVPSPTAAGIAFCIPAYYSISMFIGGAIVVVAGKWFPDWTKRFLIVVAAGVIAGHTLAGVGLAIETILTG